jgi:hypothetical protein
MLSNAKKKILLMTAIRKTYGAGLLK